MTLKGSHIDGLSLPTIADDRGLSDVEAIAVAKLDSAARRPRVEMEGTNVGIVPPRNSSKPNLAKAIGCAALGSGDDDFIIGLIKAAAFISKTQGKSDADVAAEANFILAVVNGLKPKDEAEAMLATQMAVVHRATMTYAKRLESATGVGESDIAERALNRLSRTYTVQVEALKRYRSNGTQRVIVERVVVNEGGQAIVGDVTHGGRGSKNGAR